MIRWKSRRSARACTWHTAGQVRSTDKSVCFRAGLPLPDAATTPTSYATSTPTLLLTLPSVDSGPGLRRHWHRAGRLLNNLPARNHWQCWSGRKGYSPLSGEILTPRSSCFALPLRASVNWNRARWSGGWEDSVLCKHFPVDDRKLWPLWRNWRNSSLPACRSDADRAHAVLYGCHYRPSRRPNLGRAPVSALAAVSQSDAFLFNRPPAGSPRYPAR